ncbi:DUF7472 family protein [Haloarcula pelagica]|uniref:DUF7472 family protein n=1 Tax=Haloarcula pelagica TaxID=3033389 RepID=UPI0024C46C65|nr:hypothetical protein [Halomicroarcula sp. YJ-61-S]
MDIERETVVQIVISAIALALFVAATVYVSSTYGTNGGLDPQGGIGIVTAIGVFVVFMLGAGLWLERQNF